MQQIQQGDVCFEEVKSIPKGAKLVGSVVREGKHTGHAHRISGGEVYELDGVRYIAVGSDGASVSHEEHGVIELDKPAYRILPGVFEYDYESEEAKRVID